MQTQTLRSIHLIRSVTQYKASQESMFVTFWNFAILSVVFFFIIIWFPTEPVPSFGCWRFYSTAMQREYWQGRMVGNYNSVYYFDWNTTHLVLLALLFTLQYVLLVKVSSWPWWCVPIIEKQRQAWRTIVAGFCFVLRSLFFQIFLTSTSNIFCSLYFVLLLLFCLSNRYSHSFTGKGIRLHCKLR